MTDLMGDGGPCPRCPGDRFVARVLLEGHLRMHEHADAAGMSLDDWLAQQREDAELGRAEVGHCALCGQELIRTADDCWHPHSVPKACPEQPQGMRELIDWFQAGNRTGRPGREHWRPGPARPVFPFPVVVDDRLPSNVAVVHGETTAYVDLPPRRPPVELLVEGWDGLTELLDPLLATLAPEEIQPIMARLMLVGMAVEELRK